jgi:penicillin-binding protein 2
MNTMIRSSPKERDPKALYIPLFVLIAAIFIRLIHLQVIKGDELRRRSERNSIRLIPAKAMRGAILDRNGRLIVGSRPRFAVYVVPRQVGDVEFVSRRLGEILRMDPGEIKGRIVEFPYTFNPVRIREVSKEEAAAIEEHSMELQGVILQVEPQRTYILPDLASHLIGYLREVDKERLKEDKDYNVGDMVGQIGIEKIYDKRLRGKDGGMLVEVDALGRQVAVLGEREAVNGGAVVTTIDLDTQIAAHRAMAGKRGAVVALDPNSGEVIAYVSSPELNMEKLSGFLSQKDWRRMIGDRRKPFMDRVIQGSYPPGSVFKLITAIAGLELGRINPGERVFCKGGRWVGKRFFRCWRRHGAVSLVQAIGRSCDTYFYTMALRIGPSNLARYASYFGLGLPTGIGIGPESKGFIPTPDWKRRRYGEPWYGGDTAQMGIGQGFILVTPVQLAVMASAIANGGIVYKPFFVKEVRSEAGQVVERFGPQALFKAPISQSTRDLVMEGMRMAVQGAGGTARAANIRGLDVGGKTGTAQNPHGPEHGWFVAVAPVSNPKIVVVVFLEHGRSGAAGAPIARKVISAYMSSLLRGRVALVK